MPLKPKIIWIDGVGCNGCSHSFFNLPNIEQLFNKVEFLYHPLIDTPEFKIQQSDILIVEGALRDNFLKFNSTLIPIIEKLFVEAKHVIAIGTCSSFGGVQAAYPNPTNTKGINKVISKPVINVPGCPPSAKNIVGTIVYYILFGQLPAVDNFNRPKWAYGLRIHDLCERRGHFDAGEFVESFDDKEAASNGFCLYKVGCKGPYTFNNCSRERFNQHTSWPVQAGHGCIGCSEPDFWDSMAPFEEPLTNHQFSSAMADSSADTIGLTVLTVAGVAVAAHAAFSAIKNPKE